MALEEELTARLEGQCPRVFTPTAPYGTQQPYVTWQHAGGTALRYSENTAPDIRNAFIQVNVWAATKRQAFDMLAAIEEALCEMTPVKFTTTPMEEASDAYIEGTNGQQPGDPYGALQTFSIWGER